MSKELFITTDLQKEWMAKIMGLESQIRGSAEKTDKLAVFPKENIQSLVELGYTTLTLPKKYGGGGITVKDMVLLQETIASFDGATALSIGWHQGAVGDLYENELWETSRLDHFAKDVLNGALVNRAASEAQTGSPTRGGRPRTTAVKKDGHWVITGQKNFTSMSPVLTHFLVSAWVEEREGIGFFLIKRDSEGLSIKETWNMLGMRGTESHDLVLNNVKVNEEAFVEFSKGPRGDKLNGWLLHIPACYLGIAQAARDYAVKFAVEYKPNSIQGSISELPNVQSHIGQIDLELMQARHFLYSVAAAYDDTDRRKSMKQELGAAKHVVTNAAIRIVDRSMRLVGAKSLELTNPLQRYYRDVRAGLHNPPMDDMVVSKIAKVAIEDMLND
ncbi:acyl-CoA dehydrogenase family protein [Sporosarcina thermotolerans]|uniref:Acyl-CoA dehydrogenase family protein n=1 Tax=Sporosarcina thermotolerans TaxID=633404 RepID=A0AAW9A6T8_9BACL|nr:acyl-CoA dehydrogenase family protein [Sporosarcina thermotolerans]MDW0115939.1 acyl-CoA dehydrogenase family protein [Sporosarcina thermotolerans]